MRHIAAVLNNFSYQERQYAMAWLATTQWASTAADMQAGVLSQEGRTRQDMDALFKSAVSARHGVNHAEGS